MVRMCWQEAIVMVACVVGCGDDGSSAETDTDDSSTGSTTSPSTTMSMSTSSSSSTTVDPSTTTMAPDTTGESTSSSSTTDASSTSISTGEPPTTTTGEPDTTTTGVCREDDDGDGICNDEDLCNELLATHCLEFGLGGSATFTTYSMNESGIFADLVDHDIVVGVSFDVTAVNEQGACDAAFGTFAKVFDSTVVAVTMIASDPAAQAYLDDEVLTEFEAEGVADTVRFVAQGAGATALLQVNVGANMPPGHLFAFQDNMGYMPDCAVFDLDATLTGTNGSFRLDYVGGMGVEERIQGFGGAYTLYPVP